MSKHSFFTTSWVVTHQMCQCLTGAYEVEHLQFGDNAESTSPTKQYNSTLKYKLYSFVYTIPKGTKKNTL